MRRRLELGINNVFSLEETDGTVYQVIEDDGTDINSCERCCFQISNLCRRMACSDIMREDRKSVHFIVVTPKKEEK